MNNDPREPASGTYDILIRSVGQGLREVYGATQWSAIEERAQALWRVYAGSTGLQWEDVAVRVREAWEATSQPGADR
ncbi:hypothetical protein [Lysobacter sp.]|uniref:hypothetical protein n=1 Tax=Lysobacter sp. TaxID=72226 RepID=UPI002D6513B5|nr:hypothetical protein [Lysobacter sp.]HZX76216.1 hypothetical protein [Lysobacter sp.]